MNRVGYPNGMSDVEDTFKYLDNNDTGHVNMGRFEELGLMGAPASVKRMLAFRKFLLEHYDSLADAFTAMDTKADGALSVHEWITGLKAIKCKYGHVVMQEIFYSLDTASEG